MQLSNTILHYRRWDGHIVDRYTLLGHGPPSSGPSRHRANHVPGSGVSFPRVRPRAGSTNRGHVVGRVSPDPANGLSHESLSRPFRHARRHRQHLKDVDITAVPVCTADRITECRYTFFICIVFGNLYFNWPKLFYTFHIF